MAANPMLGASQQNFQSVSSIGGGAPNSAVQMAQAVQMAVAQQPPAQLPVPAAGLMPQTGVGAGAVPSQAVAADVAPGVAPTVPGAGQYHFTSASLYVGDLHPDVTETELFNKFSPCGAIHSIRLCRDVVTRRSLGYAYINFNNATDAERALDALNFDMLRGRPIRIMWSQRDPALRRSGVGNIFIRNLEKNIDNKALYDTFSAFGNILSCKIALDANNLSRGYGFVHFETEEAAKSAIEKVNGMLLNNKKVYVGPFQQRKDRPNDQKRFTNCFVKNFGEMLDDVKLRTLFESFGNVTNAIVMRDESGKSRGFGFVSFAESGAAAQAVMTMNGKWVNSKMFTEPTALADDAIIQDWNPYTSAAAVKHEKEDEIKKEKEDDESTAPKDADSEADHEEDTDSPKASKKLVYDRANCKRIFVGRAMKRAERQMELSEKRNKRALEMRQKYTSGTNLYVKNLMDDIEDAAFRTEFAKYGTISSCRVMRDQHGRSRGFGFVCYATPEEAKEAIKEMNGHLLRGKPLYVGLAQLKSERQAVLQQQFMDRLMSQTSNDSAPFSPNFAPTNLMATTMPYSPAMQGMNRSMRPRYQSTSQQMGPQAGPRGPVPQAGPGGLAAQAGLGIPGAGLPQMGMPPNQMAISQMAGYPGALATIPNNPQLQQTINANLALANRFGQSGNWGMGAGAGGMNMAGVGGAQSNMQRILAQNQQQLQLLQQMQAGQAQVPLTQMQAAQQAQQQVHLQARQQMAAMAGQSALASQQQNAAAQQQGMAARPIMGANTGAGAAAAITVQAAKQQQVGVAQMPMTAANPNMGVAGGQAGPQGAGGQAPGPVMNPLVMQQILQQASSQNKTLMAPEFQRMLQSLPMQNVVNAQNPATAMVANQMQQIAQVQPQAQAAPAAAPANAPTGELATMLASAQPSEQKQILGERLYPLIFDIHPSFAGKITGMLLEMDNSELLHMLEARDVLNSKVSEAFEVLQQHLQRQTQPSGAAPGAGPAQPGAEGGAAQTLDSQP